MVSAALSSGTQLQRGTELELETTRKGMRYATSIGGTLTGLGAGLIIIDDPLKPQEAFSKTKREAVKQWYDTTLYSRLDNKATDVIIVVMQRLHVDDLVAHVLAKEPWVHLDLPAIADRDQIFTLTDGREVGRADGVVLHPEREPEEVLKTIQQNIGSMTFSAQYLQRPVPDEGNLIKWKWFPRYEKPPSFGAGDRIVQSWDTASKVTELADYSVCTTWHQQRNEFYLLEVFRAKLEFPQLKRAVIQQSLKWRARTILIEDSASGTALIQAIRDDRIVGFPKPIGVTAQGDKVMRLNAHTATIEAGHVYLLPQKAPWLEAFQEEVLAFPASHHDDQVDSLSQFLTWQGERHRRTIRCGTF